MRIAAHTAVGMISRRRVQAALLGLLPEATARGLGSAAAAQLRGRLLLVERDGDRRMAEVEQSGEFLGQTHRRTVPCWVVFVDAGVGTGRLNSAASTRIPEGETRIDPPPSDCDQRVRTSKRKWSPDPVICRLFPRRTRPIALPTAWTTSRSPKLCPKL
jgi:hypothetical protein